MTTDAAPRTHRRRPPIGRDPREPHRTATPLELLFDLTFVVAFGTAANELAHALAEEHVRTGLIGFGVAIFSVTWAWINYSWYASAYDTDDWVFRVATMVQMVGVVVLALGLPELFASIEQGDTLDNDVTVLGYVVMRVPMAFLWWRASRHDHGHRPACLVYLTTTTVAQLGWIVLAIVDQPIGEAFLGFAVLLLLELSGPLVAERRFGGTPWHAHHIAERYGLLVIITLGEGVIGTVASLNAVVHEQGWSVDAALVALAGIGLTFGMWWTYFAVPWAQVLAVHRKRSFGWGYGHLVVYGSLAATGAGLHVAAYYLEHETSLSAAATVLTAAVPVAIYLLALYALATALLRAFDPFHLVLLGASGVVLGAPVALAAAGADMAVCLVILTLAPVVTVAGYETFGHRHLDAALVRAGAR
jgi:low temperature requirement protein LtrA